MKRRTALIVGINVLCALAIVSFIYIASESPIKSISLVQKPNREGDFHSWASKYQRNYQTQTEYKFRLNIFLKNLEKIESHNAGDHSHKLGLNKFADWTKEEYKSILGYKQMKDKLKPAPQLVPVLAYDPVDWRTKNAVTPVKDQKSCGSCWAFSATGAIETANFLKNGEMKSLSEQQLVDCSWTFGNEGCNGGEYEYAFDYAKKTPLTIEDNYPYVARDQTCAYKEDGSVKVTSYTSILPYSAN